MRSKFPLSHANDGGTKYAFPSSDLHSELGGGLDRVYMLRLEHIMPSVANENILAPALRAERSRMIQGLAGDTALSGVSQTNLLQTLQQKF